MCGANEFELLLQTLGQTKAVVRSACAGIPKAERQVLLHPVSPAGSLAVASARQYLVEHGLAQWVAHRNLTKSHCSHRSRCSARVGDPLGAARLGDPLGATGLETAKHERKWVRRWSRRFHLQRGCFKVGPRLPFAASRLKAALPANGRRRFQNRMNPSCLFWDPAVHALLFQARKLASKSKHVEQWTRER